MVFEQLDCMDDSKCSDVQRTLRKMMVSLAQTPACGYAAQLVNYKTTSTPYRVILHPPDSVSKNIVAGVNLAYMYHTVNQDTQVAMDIMKASTFSAAGLDGYQLCLTTGPIAAVPIGECVLDSQGRFRIAAYDVLDHTCDSGQYVLVLFS
jgi:hypothetical protein